MLAEKKVCILNTTWEKELPKVIHDSLCRLIPQQYRKFVYEEYGKQQDIEQQRKELWKKFGHLKDKYISTLENLIK